MDPDGLEELSYYLRATLGMTLYVVLIDEWTCCCGAGGATLDDVRRLSFAIPFSAVLCMVGCQPDAV